jgi:hypothetical protein
MMNNRQILALILVLMLLTSLGACGGGKSGTEDPGAVAAPESGEDMQGVAEDPQGVAEEEPETPPEGEQDLSKFPQKENWTPKFPIYQNSIEWSVLPKDFRGGFAIYALTKPDNTGYVNIRENPTLDAEVIAELHPNGEAIWFVMQEFYVENGQLFVGMYKVKNDKYTWTTVSQIEMESPLQDIGWVALEVIDFGGV